jgi:predicted nucleic acid-binding protein
MKFFDANVLIYMFDADAPAKQTRARELVKQHTLAGLQTTWRIIARRLG